jgi:hypothetical protein
MVATMMFAMSTSNGRTATKFDAMGGHPVLRILSSSERHLFLLQCKNNKCSNRFR